MQAHSQPSFLKLLNPLFAVSSLFRHRNLLWQFTRRNIELRHRGSLLGLSWAILNPLMMLALYVFVFGFIFGGSFGVIPDETRWDYGLGIFLGLSIFHLIAESITTAPAVIVGNPNFVKKVVFPLEVLPASVVGAAVFHMTITIMMIAFGLVLGGRGLSASALWLPLIMTPIVALALGLAWLLAALGVFFRDIGQIVGALTTGLMFASAIFYPVSEIPHEAWQVLRFNPLIDAIEMARDTVLWSRPIDWSRLVFLYGSSLAVAVLGFAFFSRLKRTFADVI